MLGMKITDSAQFAAAAAAISVSRPGAQPSMPTMDEVQTLLHEQKRRFLTKSSEGASTC
jgi:ribokinase